MLYVYLYSIIITHTRIQVFQKGSGLELDYDSASWELYEPCSEEVVYCDELFPSVSNSEAGCSSAFLDETRAIKAAQDEAYEESLAIDRAKVFCGLRFLLLNYTNFLSSQ